MQSPTILALLALPFLGSWATVWALEPYHRFAPRSDGIEWGPCKGSDDGNATCGHFEVPLDWADYTKGKARLAVIKYAATNEPRKGTLFTNPGGPGASGVDTMLSLGPSVSELSGGYYDIVSWDPRGVGQTIPGKINCFDSMEEYVAFWNGTMVYPQMDVRGAFELQSDIDYLYSQITPMDERWKALGEVCAKRESGQFIPYVGTTAAVRDMVALADYLEGNSTLVNYWGFSYGTNIGTYFLGMYPQRVGRFILDGVEDPVTHAMEPAHLTWARTVESVDEAFLGLVEGCAKAGPQGCKISTENSTGVGIIQWTSDLLNLAYDYGKKSGDAGISAVAIRSAIHQTLYNPSQWPGFVNGNLWETYEALSNKSGTTIPLAPRALPSSPTLARREGEQDWPDYLLHAVVCGDSVDDQTTTKEVFDEIVRVVKEVSPMFGQGFLQGVHYCHKWPLRAVERFQGPFNVTSLSNKVLLIGNRADPTTPYVDAHRVREYLGDNAILIEQNGLGHLSLAQHSSCTHSAVLNYLVDGTLPTADILCQIDFGKDMLFPKESTTSTETNTATPNTTTPDACTPLSSGPAAGGISRALGDDASNRGAIDTLENDKRTLRIVIFVLAGFIAILLIVIATLLHRGRKGVKYVPVSLRGDYPDHYGKGDFTRPRYSTQM